MRIDELMTSPPECCRVDERLDDAVRRMWERDCGFLPIVDGEGSAVGVLTDRDVALAACEQGLPLAEIPIGSAMTLNPVCCTPSDDVDDVAAILRDAQVRRLPVVDGGLVVGVISLNDIVLATREAELPSGPVMRTFARICEHRTPV